jgi:general secretion pathway protein K
MVRAALSARTRGAALVLAMLVAALAAIVAVAVAAEQQRWFADVANRRDQVQAQALALAGVQWARQIMFDDARNGALDYLGEPWSYPLPRTPLENGSIEGSIVDAQGRLNVNNLLSTDARGGEERARLERLFVQQGVPAATLDAIADWIDADQLPRPGGAEDAAYMQMASPSLAANAPLVRTAELAAVRGVSSRDVARLAPFIAALPAGTTLNVNTAPPEVIAAAVPGLEGSALSGLLADRARKPFSTIAEFRARLPGGATIGSESSLGVASNYFLVSVRARQGDALAQARALLKRDGGTWPTVVWQTLE